MSFWSLFARHHILKRLNTTPSRFIFQWHSKHIQKMVNGVIYIICIYKVFEKQSQIKRLETRLSKYDGQPSENLNDSEKWSDLFTHGQHIATNQMYFEHSDIYPRMYFLTNKSIPSSETAPSTIASERPETFTYSLCLMFQMSLTYTN